MSGNDAREHRGESEYGSVREAALEARAMLARTAGEMLGPGPAPDDSRWWFTSTYVRTTEGAIEEADAGTFRDPVRILRLVCYFERLYRDSLGAESEGRAPEPHWERAFAVARRVDGRRRRRARLLGERLGRASVIGVARSVIAASRAHVRFDLPRAMAWVDAAERSADHGGARTLAPWLGDFMAMAAVFDRAALAANLEVAWRTGVPIERLPGRARDWGMRFLFRADLIHERAWAWNCAEALVRSGGAGTCPYREPRPGRLEGDATRGEANPFAAIDPRLRPSMGRMRTAQGDLRARRLALRGLAGAGPAERIRALQGLCHGITGRADERAVIRILESSERRGELVEVVNGVGAWELAANLHGRSLRRLRGLFRRGYYRQVQPSIAVALLDRALRYVTLGWERTLICDLVGGREDGPALVDRLDGGWSRLAAEISPDERRRLLDRRPELARTGADPADPGPGR